MKQTAIEWLLSNKPNIGKFIPLGVSIEFQAKINKAMEIEKNQIKSAWNDGRHICGKKNNTAEEYYNETYETQND